MVVIATSNSTVRMDALKKPDLDAQIRHALRVAIRHSGKSRDQIAEELRSRHGLNISVPILNNWTGDSKRERRVPAVMVPALCAVLGDQSLQRLLLNEEQVGKLELGECVAKWLGKRFTGWKTEESGKRLRIKAGRSAAGTAGRP